MRYLEYFGDQPLRFSQRDFCERLEAMLACKISILEQPSRSSVAKSRLGELSPE